MNNQNTNHNPDHEYSDGDQATQISVEVMCDECGTPHHVSAPLSCFQLSDVNELGHCVVTECTSCNTKMHVDLFIGADHALTCYETLNCTVISEFSQQTEQCDMDGESTNYLTPTAITLLQDLCAVRVWTDANKFWLRCIQVLELDKLLNEHQIWWVREHVSYSGADTSMEYCMGYLYSQGHDSGSSVGLVIRTAYKYVRGLLSGDGNGKTKPHEEMKKMVLQVITEHSKEQQNASSEQA